MWKTDRPSAGTQEFPVQGCKQPRLDLVAIAQLVAFGRPDIECLLREITRVVQAKYEDALHGRAQEYLEWLDIVEQPSGVTT